jgi:aldehyde:ferredoxin oxidoreductase
MNSVAGKILYVDLTKKKVNTAATPDDWVNLYAGQKGLGARILMEEVDPRIEPLSPENTIVLTTSIMAGTIVSCSAKLAITTKSPLTGTITDGSVGGHIGGELKYAGYDAVVIRGKAEKLSYLYIDPDRIEIRDAEELATVGTFATESRLKQSIGDDQVKIMAIGPAGENLVRYACISSERYRQLGRGGIGAIMGSKKLKAIAIRGWLDVHVADVQKCMELAMSLHEQDAVTAPENEIYEFGTPVLVEMAQDSGLLPTRNFQVGTFAEHRAINGDSFKALRKNKKACFSCGIACGNYVQAGDAVVEGPEFETIALCGSSIGNGDPEKLVALNALCDDLGMDTISTGGVLAYMMEATERKIHDFGIRFGDSDKALKIAAEIASLQGIGKDAALGSLNLAEKYGGVEYAMQNKGQELPGYDPRGSWGMGLGYVTAPRGGCHMSCYPIAEEAWGTIDPFTFEGKGKLVAEMQNAQFAKFSMGVCDFWPISSETLGKLYEVTYGGSWPVEKVDRVGERIFNLQRMFNVMAGFTRKQDYLPDRFYEETLQEGPPKDKAMTRAAFEEALDDYYAIRGWDKEGRPTVAKLKELGIEEDFIKSYEKTLKTKGS